jgi:hypothetical protein
MLLSLFIGNKFMRKAKAKVLNKLIIISLVLLFLSGCAAQHKYKKNKAVPCPCEKEYKH